MFESIILSSELCAIDTESDDKNPHHAILFGISFSAKKGEAFFVPLLENDLKDIKLQEVRSTLDKIFQSQIQFISLVVSTFEISLATESWHLIDKLIRETQDKYPEGRPFIGRYEEHGGQGKLHGIEFPFHTMVKFQETISKVQDFQNRQKMQGRAAS